jgi:predicted  nucleic acid-binding Zn-ribbon protein
MDSAERGGPAAPATDDVETRKLVRENDYLKLRCAQLQDDVTDLSSQLTRARQELERLHGQRAARNGASGGG